MIANDPDADRLAVAVPDPDADGGWRRLTGNEIGLLLGWRAARLAADAGAAPGASLACSLVSSPGTRARSPSTTASTSTTTLTGFKWISRAPGLVFGFEEALGYLVNPETVRDKDGISAAVAMLGLVTEARGRGATPRRPARRVRRDLRLLRERSDLDPRRRRLAHRADHGGAAGAASGIDRRRRGRRGRGSARRAWTTCRPATCCGCWLADGSRVIVRPSGTEPKLKVYLDVRGDSADDAKARITALSDGARALLDELG